MQVKKGDLYFADLSPVIGSEQGGVRPVLVVQNNVGNRYSPTIIVAAVTSQKNKANLPTHVEIAAERIGTVDHNRLPDVDEALGVSLGITGHTFE